MLSHFGFPQKRTSLQTRHLDMTSKTLGFSESNLFTAPCTIPPREYRLCARNGSPPLQGPRPFYKTTTPLQRLPKRDCFHLSSFPSLHHIQRRISNTRSSRRSKCLLRQHVGSNYQILLWLRGTYYSSLYSANHSFSASGNHTPLLVSSDALPSLLHCSIRRA
jgi:hypothetical protein